VTPRPIAGSLLRLLASALLGALVMGSYAAVQVSAQGDRDERQAADAIVVLGAAQYNGTPTGVFAARLEHAVALFHDEVAPLLIVTGGKLPNDRTTESETARRWAIAHGVPPDSILGEDRGRTTLESIEAVAAIMRSEGLTSAVFVSDETHMLRVLRMASDQGIVSFGSPTRTSPTDKDENRRRKAMLHELAGLAAYYVGGARFFEDAAIASSP
jgi:uncharacterized SAM-binding protein YcdF (DUF218 family)